jgi:hypothetical protein
MSKAFKRLFTASARQKRLAEMRDIAQERIHYIDIEIAAVGGQFFAIQKAED